MTALPTAPVGVPSPAQSTPSLITAAVLLAAGASADGVRTYGPHLAASAERRGIVSRNPVAALLTMDLNESGGLTRVNENLYYTSATRISQVFPSHFPTPASAVTATCNPVALGNRVYAALGGYDGRGHGLGQVTGTANHIAYARDIGRSLADARAYMLTPEGAADSSCWYFVTCGCMAPAERGDLLAVRQIWAGNHSENPMGWLDERGGPGPVQVWGAKVRASLAGPETIKSGAGQVIARQAAADRVPPGAVADDGGDVSFPA